MLRGASAEAEAQLTSELEGSQADGQWTSPLPDQPFLNGSSPFYPS